jgi:hypothetical protein
MREDLLEAIASVDWVEARLPALDEQIKSWLDDNIEIVFVDTPEPATHDVIVAREKDLLPLEFNITAGAYINVLRSALDILAFAIGKREIVLNPDTIYFPVADSEADFVAGNYKGSEFVRQLSADSRSIIEKFLPYRGGHEGIWATHDLDIMRKHKRLLTVYVRPASWRVTGWGIGQTYKPIDGPGYIEAGNGETALGLLAKGAKRPDVKANMHVVFAPGTVLPGRPVVSAIHGFARTIRAVISAFD